MFKFAKQNWRLTTQIDNQNLEQNQNQTNQHYQHQVSNTTASYELLDLKSTDTTKSQHYQTSSNSSCSSSSGSMMSMNSGLKLKNAQDLSIFVSKNIDRKSKFLKSFNIFLYLNGKKFSYLNFKGSFVFCLD